MKNLLFASIALLALSGCNAVKLTQSWAAKNCTTTQVDNYTIVKCENLYPTEKVKQVCPTAKVEYDIANATVEIKANCLDSLNIFDAVKAIAIKK